MSQTLIPAFVSFNLGSQEVGITDTQLSLNFSNGSGYEECMLKDGKKGYLLKKGTTILQQGDVNITLTKSPDGKQDASIKAVEEAMKKSQDNDAPDQYTDSITFSISNSGEKEFMTLSFTGYVSEVVGNTPNETDFAAYTAKIEVYDPLSISIGP